MILGVLELLILVAVVIGAARLLGRRSHRRQVGAGRNPIGQGRAYHDFASHPGWHRDHSGPSFASVVAWSVLGSLLCGGVLLVLMIGMVLVSYRQVATEVVDTQWRKIDHLAEQETAFASELVESLSTALPVVDRANSRDAQEMPDFSHTNEPSQQTFSAAESHEAIVSALDFATPALPINQVHAEPAAAVPYDPCSRVLQGLRGELGIALASVNEQQISRSGWSSHDASELCKHLPEWLHPSYPPSENYAIVSTGLYATEEEVEQNLRLQAKPFVVARYTHRRGHTLVADDRWWHDQWKRMPAESVIVSGDVDLGRMTSRMYRGFRKVWTDPARVDGWHRSLPGKWWSNDVALGKEMISTGLMLLICSATLVCGVVSWSLRPANRTLRS